MRKLVQNLVGTVIFLGLSTTVYAGGSTQHFGASLDHSAQAIGHSTAAGVKLVSGAVAIPLLMGGEIGKVSGEIGEVLWEEANTPLPITEEVITASPTPAKAMADEEKE